MESRVEFRYDSKQRINRTFPAWESLVQRGAKQIESEPDMVGAAVHSSNEIWDRRQLLLLPYRHRVSAIGLLGYGVCYNWMCGRHVNRKSDFVSYTLHYWKRLYLVFCYICYNWKNHIFKKKTLHLCTMFVGRFAVVFLFSPELSLLFAVVFLFSPYILQLPPPKFPLLTPIMQSLPLTFVLSV